MRFSWVLAACTLVLASALPFEATAAPACGGSSAHAEARCRGHRPRHAARGRRGHGRHRGAHRARPPRPRVSLAYVRMRTRWHRPPTAAERVRWLRASPPPLVLRPVGGGRSFSLVPDAHGAFDDAQLTVASEAFTYRDDGQSHDVHPRLLELCYRAVRHFRAPYVHLVSGYRTTRSTSRHNQGRAMDIVLPGVREEQLAAFFRRQGFVGVGVYPTSGFVHLDVRARSYYWVDSSGPEQESMVRPVRAGEVARNDAAARRLGERPVPDLVGGAAESDESGATRVRDDATADEGATAGAAEGGEAEPTLTGATSPAESGDAE